MSCPILPARRRLPRDVAAFDALLLHWLVLGVLILLLLPLAHWHNPWIGWLPFWLVLAPGLALAARVLQARPRRLQRLR